MQHVISQLRARTLSYTLLYILRSHTLDGGRNPATYSHELMRTWRLMTLRGAKTTNTNAQFQNAMNNTWHTYAKRKIQQFTKVPSSALRDKHSHHEPGSISALAYSTIANLCAYNYDHMAHCQMIVAFHAIIIYSKLMLLPEQSVDLEIQTLSASNCIWQLPLHPRPCP